MFWGVVCCACFAKGVVLTGVFVAKYVGETITDGINRVFKRNMSEEDEENE